MPFDNNVRLVRVDGRAYRVEESEREEEAVPSANNGSRQSRAQIAPLQAREEGGYTHFLSIPLNSADCEELRKSFAALKAKVLALKLPNLRDTDFIRPAALHITIGMLSLPTAEHVERARRLLQWCQRSVYDAVDTRSVVVRLEGLDAMGNDGSRATVLYARVIDEGRDGRLMALCKLLRTNFHKDGLLGDALERPLKLHATLLNLNKSQRAADDRERRSFDARNLLRQYRNTKFAVLRASRIEISRRHDNNPDGSYPSEAHLSLP